MKKYEVKVGMNKVVWEMDEKRLESFTSDLDNAYMPYEVNEITEPIDRRGKWYITFKSGETRYCDSECEMWKTLYFAVNEKAVDVYGLIY